MRILFIENYAHCCFCNDSSHFFILSLSAKNFTIFIQGLSILFFFSSSVKSTFLVSKGLLCWYDKQNKTWFRADMEFLFSCSTRHLTRSLCSLVSYLVELSKRNSLSTRVYVYKRATYLWNLIRSMIEAVSKNGDKIHRDELHSALRVGS